MAEFAEEAKKDKDMRRKRKIMFLQKFLNPKIYLRLKLRKLRKQKKLSLLESPRNQNLLGYFSVNKR